MSSIPYVSRVNQLDAMSLDDEINKVFENQIKEIFKFCPPGKMDKWQPEIKVILKILIWNFSLRYKSHTFGQQMLDLRYDNLNKFKSILYLAFKLLPNYIKDRLIDNGMISNHKRMHKLKIYVQWIISLVHLLELINLISFLHRGTQPLLIERLLNISSVSVNQHKPRTIGYSYMTRELLWHGLMELFTLGIPMLNYHYLKQKIRRFWYHNKKDGIKKTFPIMNESTVCAYCKEKPILPTHAGCEHVFCYYCLGANFTAMKIFLCPECDTELHDCDMKNYIAVPDPPFENDNLQ
ncbi:peroxisome biogenesis factor 2 [Vespa velutina]|uniref:peroxisome biogenesis factor 2 n=1 Tax=Vespa velutina TaxID=202808 RepID=UPI001FB366F7|nr:peroxisome biogenesis factor 2 [Vespa velutina]